MKRMIHAGQDSNSGFVTRFLQLNTRLRPCSVCGCWTGAGDPRFFAPESENSIDFAKAVSVTLIVNRDRAVTEEIT